MLAFANHSISFWNPYKTSSLLNNFFQISEPASTVENQLHATPLMTAVDYDEDEDSSEDDEDSDDDDTSVTDICESLSSDSCSDLDILYWGENRTSEEIK